MEKKKLRIQPQVAEYIFMSYVPRGTHTSSVCYITAGQNVEDALASPTQTLCPPPALLN